MLRLQKNPLDAAAAADLEPPRHKQKDRMSQLAQDLRYDLRAFGQRPAFALIAVLTLTLEIGATTAIFSVMNDVLLHPLPYQNADRIVTIWQTDAHQANERLL